MKTKLFFADANTVVEPMNTIAKDAGDLTIKFHFQQNTLHY